MTAAAEKRDDIYWTRLMADLCGPALTAEEKAARLLAVEEADITGAMLAAAAAYLLDHALPLSIEGIDVCGTGGDSGKNSVKTFNISTAVAFVLAAGGVSVVKHGNRGVSSLSGSSDVLAALNVPVCTAADDALKQHGTHGLCFISAPAFHPALGILAPIRRSLGRPSFLNLLGPLCNPARTSKQLIGVYSKAYLPAMAEAAQLLGRSEVMAVHSDDGLDEISISAMTHVARLKNGIISENTLVPEMFGVKEAPLEKLAGGTAQQNGAIIHAVFSGTGGPLLDIICVNAAAGFMMAGKADNLTRGYALAKETVQRGAALAKLKAMKVAPPA